uniref:Wsv089 n=1 Tax=White spot syndrome virus TaxID=342409 RepID=A0A8E7BW97_9VIRU|nr:MAG: hypothetical protein KOBFAEHK_00126 [White spot syndrome virus]
MTHLVLLILSLSLSPVYHHLTPYLSPHLTYTPPPSHPSPLYSPTLFTRSSFNTLFLPSQPITRSGPQSSLLSLTGTIYAPQALAVYIRRRGQARSISSLQASRRATQQALSLLLPRRDLPILKLQEWPLQPPPHQVLTPCWTLSYLVLRN